MTNDTLEALTDAFYATEEQSGRDEAGATITDGLFAIARALDGVARALRDLGTGNAATPMGAIELLAMETRDGFRGIVGAIETHASAIEALHSDDSAL